MSKNPRDDYFEYVENVLGIKQVLLDRVQNAEVNEDPEDVTEVRLVISVQDLNKYLDSEKELLFKMISALQLKPEAYVVIDQSARAKYKAGFELYLNDDPDDQAQLAVETYSPRVLIQRPDLKRMAWAKMQALMQKL